MSRLVYPILFIFSFSFLYAQTEPSISSGLQLQDVESHIRFLASDELEGRKAGSKGCKLAARYIAEQFRKYGVKTVPGHNSYYQSFNLDEVNPAQAGSITGPSQKYTHGDNMLVMGGEALDFEGPLVYVGYGASEEAYQGLEVAGKIVVARIGESGNSDARNAFQLSPKKRVIAQEKKAAGFIELYDLPISWTLLKNYLSSTRLQLPGEAPPSLPVFWVNDPKQEMLAQVDQKAIKTLNVQSSGAFNRKIPTQNVLGFIEGSDPQLKDEYILLSAHYDHVGYNQSGDPGFNPKDSIFNGARDNAVGTTAILNAAQEFAKNPPRRSVVLIAFTAEESGLLGSSYYADHPMLPLRQCIFNLNIDGAGYNDTSIVTIFGLDRTGAAAQIKQGTSAFGLQCIEDPAPEQGLFDRSDNVSFAAKGIPSPTFSLGFTAFDEEINKYYHQVSDQADNLDYPYLLKFCQSYIYTAQLIANLDQAPRWQMGDKYEPAAKKLYQY